MAYEKDREYQELWQKRGHKLAEALSKIDSVRWRFIPDTEYRNHLTLKAVDSARNEVLSSGVSQGRMDWGGQYGTLPNGSSWWPNYNYNTQAENPRAGISAERDIDAVARDIKRKILDGGYRFYLDKYAEACKKQDEHFTQSMLTLSAVCSTFDILLMDHYRKSMREGKRVGLDLTKGKPYCSVSIEAYGVTSVDVTSLRVPVSCLPQLKTLVEAIRAATPKESEES